MSTNTKKKRGAGAAVVIIVLCLAALGALGYVIWQQFHPAVPETAAESFLRRAFQTRSDFSGSVTTV